KCNVQSGNSGAVYKGSPAHPQQTPSLVLCTTYNIMKLLIILAVVAAANCAAVLKSLPSNSRIEYEHDKYGRLVEVDIDHFAPVPVAKKAAAPKPAPAAPATVVKFLPAAPV
ncbi:unnamed protein product, partial [Meganyctiphanes norvegica]